MGEHEITSSPLALGEAASEDSLSQSLTPPLRFPLRRANSLTPPERRVFAGPPLTSTIESGSLAPSATSQLHYGSSAPWLSSSAPVSTPGSPCSLSAPWIYPALKKLDRANSVGNGGVISAPCRSFRSCDSESLEPCGETGTESAPQPGSGSVVSSAEISKADSGLCVRQCDESAAVTPLMNTRPIDSEATRAMVPESASVPPTHLAPLSDGLSTLRRSSSVPSSTPASPASASTPWKFPALKALGRATSSSAD